MKILAIETSCDETAAAVVEDGQKILSNVVVSQIDIFAAYGGVIPEVAARSHLEVILPVIHKALDDAGLDQSEIDVIAVTHTPGLMGSLMIGTLTARMLAILWQKPLYAVHHLKSHIYANWLLDLPSLAIASSELATTPSLGDEPSSVRCSVLPSTSSKMTASNVSGDVSVSASLNCPKAESHRDELNPRSKIASSNTFSSGPYRNQPSSSSSSKMTSSKTVTQAGLHDGEVLLEFPLLALVISGGHTQIIYMSSHNHFEIIGTTRDDAVGECFDKVAKILGLPYPGGPSIAKTSANSSLSFPVRTADFPKENLSAGWRLAKEDISSFGSTSTAGRRMSNTSPLRSSSSPRTNSKFVAIDERDWFKEHPDYRLPHPHVDGLDFSFSGLKTAVLRAVQGACHLPITTPSYELQNYLSEQQKADFAASFQQTACEILLEKLQKALESHPEVRSIVFAGGVSANQRLRGLATSGKYFGGEDIQVYFPEPKFSGDNAAMVGAAAYFEIKDGVPPTDPYSLSIAPRTKIDKKS